MFVFWESFGSPVNFNWLIFILVASQQNTACLLFLERLSQSYTMSRDESNGYILTFDTELQNKRSVGCMSSVESHAKWVCTKP